MAALQAKPIGLRGLAVLLLGAVLGRDELRHQGQRHRVSWGHNRASQHGMVAFGLAVGALARQALRAAELLRAEVFRAVERDQHAAAELLERQQPAMPAQRAQDFIEGGLQVRGMHRVEHGADVVVGGHGRHAELAVAVRNLPPFLQRAGGRGTTRFA